MATRIDSLPLVVIVGPTASGKTALSIDVAKRYHGEIICADSRTIYTGMDIGTAKPSLEERQGIVHWGLDLVRPDQPYSAALFQHYAVEKIADIRARNHLPILVGGSGLYVDSVLYEYDFSGSQPDTARRQQLEHMDIAALQRYCLENNIKLPENDKNKRYVINNIIRNGHAPKRRKGVVENTFVVGIATEKEELRQRIARRSQQIFDDGVVDEAVRLREQYGEIGEAMTANIYRLIFEHLRGTYSLDETKRRAELADWHLAKRQLTWLRRNHDIVWQARNVAYAYICRFIDSEQ